MADIFPLFLCPSVMSIWLVINASYLVQMCITGGLSTQKELSYYEHRPITMDISHM